MALAFRFFPWREASRTRQETASAVAWRVPVLNERGASPRQSDPLEPIEGQTTNGEQYGTSSVR